VTPRGHEPRATESDAAKAIRFMAIKAAVFILLPLAVAAVVVSATLK
jgi:hypothetical protein